MTRARRRRPLRRSSGPPLTAPVPSAAVVDVERTVLVVDDDPVILRLLEVNFDMEGFLVRMANDGVEGLESARAEPPDIIVSDVMMPRMNGLELVANLKADPATASIPVILL